MVEKGLDQGTPVTGVLFESRHAEAGEQPLEVVVRVIQPIQRAGDDGKEVKVSAKKRFRLPMVAGGTPLYLSLDEPAAGTIVALQFGRCLRGGACDKAIVAKSKVILYRM